VGAVVVVSPAFAADVSPGVYVGGALSLQGSQSIAGKVDAALASQGITSTRTRSSDDPGVGPSLRLGYRVNTNVAVEATLDNAGGTNIQSAMPAPVADSATGSWRARGLGLHVLGIQPVNDKLAVYGRVGLEQWRSKLNLASNAGGPTAIANTGSSTGLALGAGASYAVTPSVDATAELIHYTHGGIASSTGRTGLNAVNVGLLYHFM
jgi:opacity protein-like surface antigen